MGEGDRRLKGRQVNFVYRVVFGVSVGFIYSDGTLESALHIVESHLVDGEDAVLCASLYCHVAHREPVVYRKVFYAVSRELHALVKRAVDAYHSYDVQYQVLAAYVFRGLSVQNELNGGGYLEPACLAYHSCRHVRRAYARRERAQRAVCAGMAVGAYHKIACAYKSQLGQKSVLYAHFAYVVEVFNALFLGKYSARLALFGALNVLIGRKVIHNKRNLVLFGYILRSRFSEFPYCHGTSYVVCQHQVKLCRYQLTCLDLLES